MNKLKIAIGTNSKYKLNFIEKVMHDFNLDFEIKNSEVDSGISTQPCKLGETKAGSINRAKEIMKCYPESDFGIGVEFGYEPDGDNFKMHCWASIYTKEGNIFSEQSSTLELPKLMKGKLLNNEEIGEIVNEFVDSLEFSEAKNRFSDIILKKRVIEESVTNVMIRFVLKELY